MLWLAGLIGCGGIGVASSAMCQSQQKTDASVTPPDEASDPENIENLLKQMTGLTAGEDCGKQITGTGAYDLRHGADGKDLIRVAKGNDLFFGEFERDTHHRDAEQDPPGRGDGRDPVSDKAKDPLGREVVDHGSGDFLDTAAHIDAQVIGSKVWVAGGRGSEHVKLGDWVMEGQPSEPLDYNARKDSLMLVWNDLDNGATEPDVKVASDSHDPEVMHIVMNGRSVAEIYGDANLTVRDVTLIPLSSALIVGLEPA